ncbi:MAG: YHS domain-containing protein [Gammaproteobacteria bacterium]|nr:YHS domain-containing protein [Gammaproteobacteria bacterium]
MAIDPVCKMEIQPEHAAIATMEYEGKKYYFCSETCHNKFKSDPEKFLSEEDNIFPEPHH